MGEIKCGNHKGENKYIPRQNVGEDTSQQLVGKHLPHKQQSQSIYHTTVHQVCVFMSAHAVCVSTGREMQSVLNY